MDENRKNQLLADIKTNCTKVYETMQGACTIAETAVNEGRLTEYDLETMLATTENFLEAAVQIQRGAAGDVVEGAKDPAA